MDEKTKAQIQQEAADLVAKLQPRSGKFRTISPEMDPLRLGSGWSIEDLDKPQVIIESTFGDSHPGSAGLFELVEEVRAGVAEAGGHGARYFCTDICDGEAQGHDGINYSLAHREAITNLVEAQANATTFDGGVFISSCDKAMPAMLMSIGRMKDMMAAIVVTGGVMEAALRTAYAVVEGKNPEADAFRAVRGRDGRREADFTLGDQTLHTCTVSGLANAEKLMEDIKAGRVSYDFVEVMACPGGCVGGGGQPIHDGCEFAERRGGTLYRLDSERKLRFSHENPEVQKAYEEFLGKPLSRTAHKLLHSEHVNELYFETHNYL